MAPSRRDAVVNPKMYPEEVPVRYKDFLFPNGPRDAINVVRELIEQLDRYADDNAKLVKLDTWDTHRLPSAAEHQMFKDGPMTSAEFVQYLFQSIFSKRDEIKKTNGRLANCGEAIKVNKERINELERENTKIFEDNKAKDQQLKAMQGRPNVTIDKLRSEKKLLSDDNAKQAKALAQEQIAKKQLQTGNAQKDELIQQLQERITVLEQQPQASNDPEPMVEDLPDGTLTPEQQIQYLQDDLTESQEQLKAASSNVESLQKKKIKDAAKIQLLGDEQRDTLRQMRETVSAVQQKLDDQLQEQDDAAAKIRDLEKRLEDGSDKDDEENKQLQEQLQEQLNQSTQREDELKQTIAGLEQEKTDNLATIQSLLQPSPTGDLTAAQVQALQNSLTQSAHRENEAYRRAASLDCVVIKVRRQRDIAETARDSQSDKLVKKCTAYESVCQELMTAKGQLRNYMEQLDKVVEENDQLIQNAGENEDASDAQRVIQKLHAENEDLRRRHDVIEENQTPEDEEGDVIMSREGIRATQQMFTDLENKSDKLKKRRQTLSKEVLKLRTQLISEPDGTIVTQEDYDALNKTNKLFTTQAINRANEHFKEVQELRADNIYHTGAKVTQEQFEDMFSKASQAATHDNGDMITQEQWVETLARARQAAVNEDNSVVSQQQWVDTRAKASQAAMHDNGDMVTQQQWVETLARAHQAAIHEDNSVVSQQQWVDTRAKASQAAIHEDNSVVTQQQWVDTRVRASLAAIHEDNSIVTQQQWVDIRARASLTAIHEDNSIVTQQQWVDTRVRASLAAIHEDNSLVTQQQWVDIRARFSLAAIHKDNSIVTQEQWVETRARALQAATNEDGTLVTNEQVQKLDFLIIRKSDGSVGTIEEVRELEGQVTTLRAKLEDLDAKLIRNDTGAILTTSEIQQQWNEREAHLVSEAKKAKDDKDVAEKKCLGMGKDITDLRAQAVDSQKKETTLATEAKEANEGKDIAEKKCLAMDKDMADLKEDARKKETDLTAEVKEAKESRNIAEKKFIAIEKDMTKMKAKLKEAHKATDYAEKQLSEMKKNGAISNVKHENGTIVDQQVYDDEAKTRRKVIAYLQSIIGEGEAKIAALQLTITEGEAKITALQLTVTEREAKITALQLTVTEGEAKITALELGKKEDEEEKTRLKAESKSTADENVDLRKGKLEEEKEIIQLKEDLSSAKDEISKLEAAPLDSADKVQDLEDAFTRLQDLYKQQGRELEHIESSQADLEQAHEEKVKEVKQGMLKQVEPLQHELKQTLEKFGKLEQEHSLCATMKSNLTNLQSRINKVEKELSQKDEELKSARKELDRMDELKEKTLEAQNNALTDLKQALTELSESKEDNQILATGKAEVEANLEAVAQESIGLMKAMDGLRDDITSQRQVIEDLEAEISVLQWKIQKKAGPSEPEAPVTDSSAKKPPLHSIAEENEDDQIADTELPVVLDDASNDDGGAGVPELPRNTEIATGNFNGQGTASGAQEGPVTSIPILPRVPGNASHGNGSAGAPELPHATGTAANNSNGQKPASGVPPTIVPDQNHHDRPPATSGLGWKINGLLWLLLLLLFFGVSLGVSWWRRTELIGRGDDVARLALISLRAGGGTGTAWPAWLYDDEVAEIVGGFYG